MNNNTVNFYDLKSDEMGLPYIEKWNSKIVSRQVNGKIETCYESSIKEIEQPTDIRKAIVELKSSGFISYNRFQTSDFTLNTNFKEMLNPLMHIKLSLLGRKHVLLEKVYDDKAVVKGMHSIARYIHYINVETGQEYVLCIDIKEFDDFYPWAFEKEGYKNIQNSVIFQFLSTLKYTSEAIEIDSSTINRLQK